MDDDSIKRIETFFEDDLKAKKILNDIVPNVNTLNDDDSIFKYIDKLNDGLELLKLYITRMMLNYGVPKEVERSFVEKIDGLKLRVNTPYFYNLLKQGYSYALEYVNGNISNMREEFITSVNRGFVGYWLFYGSDVLDPITINEFLHYTHSYVINNEYLYSSIPEIRRNVNKQGEIILRGFSTEIGDKLFEKINDVDIQSDCIDIINLGEHILIMARDLGHATVIEINLEDEKAFVKYNIPKNTNKEMASLIRGIQSYKSKFAYGDFQTSKEKIVDDICQLMMSIPTDANISKNEYNK